MLAAMTHISTPEQVHLSLAIGSLLSFPSFVNLDQAQSLLNQSRPLVLDDNGTNSTPVLLQVLLAQAELEG